MPAEPLPSRLEFPRRPIPVKARLREPVELPEYLPARMLNEFVYCPRLFFYEWVDGVFAHSADTVEGALRHEGLDRKADELPGPDEAAEVIHARSVTLASERIKIIARIDLVEGSEGVVVPVDYKRGAPRDGDNGLEAWPADRAQATAQVLILRDNGYRCDEAIIYYNATKQRVRVPVDDAAAAETTGAIVAARTLARTGRIPPPLVDSPKCPRCSLVGICLPDETMRALSVSTETAMQAGLFPDEEEEERRPLGTDPDTDLRRLVPARDDLRPLYVTGHGLTIGKSGEVLQVRDRKRVIQEARLNDIAQVSVFGNVQVSAAAIQGLCSAEKPLAHFSAGGWFYGLTRGLDLKNVFLRRDQFRRAEEPDFCLRVSRDIVATKIRNQRTLLQRNHVEPPSRSLELLKRLAQRAEGAPDLESLLGMEGTAARVYFEHFDGMLKAEGDAGADAFDFGQRNRRPPRDPVNALLSLAYSLLSKDVTIACHAIGFDPYLGFYHQPRFGRPALALDLMEGFRPIVADSAVLVAVNGRMVTAGDFVRAGGAVALTPAGRRALSRAYEQRMDTLVTHPLFGYRVSYRRVLEIQGRLLARAIMGEIARYPGFETR